LQYYGLRSSPNMFKNSVRLTKKQLDIIKKMPCDMTEDEICVLGELVGVQIESDEPYIRDAHRLCPESVSGRSDIVTCLGWHSYKKSNQLWHVGGVGTFRSSIIINRPRKIGVVVLGNSKGRASANVHYLAKMLYSEMKIKKIIF